MKATIQKIIAGALEEAHKNGDITLGEDPDIPVEEPRDPKLGDYATTIAMAMANREKKNPRVIAEVICKRLNNGAGLVKSAEIAGPGFINLRMSRKFFTDRLLEAIEEGDSFGRSEFGNGERINLEFVSANPTGPLHVGHGRGAAVGDTLGNLLRWAGYDVTKEYYINDVGNQIKNLGDSAWLRYRELYGEKIDFPDDYYKGEYIKDIAQDIQKKHGDRLMSSPENKRKNFFMQFANDHVLESIKKDLADFRVHHDIWFSERILHEQDQVERAVIWLRENNFIYEKDGAVWLKSSAVHDEKDRVIIKQTGEKTYFCSDIAYHQNKIHRGFSRIIDVWGADHHGYVPRMQAVIDAMKYDPKAFKVILVQFVTLKRGKEKVQMSTRSGEFVTLAEVVSEVGVDAARFFFLMRNFDSHLDFDLDLAKKETAENPVYYIQYAHARLFNVFLTAKEKGIDPRDTVSVDLSLLKEEELILIKKILTFPEIIEKSARSLEVHRLPFYLQDLAAAFHGYYNRERIVTDDVPASCARLLVMNCLRLVFKNGLTLLGISVPEKM